MKTFTREELKKIQEACNFINDDYPITLDILIKVKFILKLKYMKRGYENGKFNIYRSIN
mgnify:CR=1 FL=1